MAYAAEMAGTHFDLDADLESAGIEHLVKTGKARRLSEAKSIWPIWPRGRDRSKRAAVQ